jgi:hypothetical protein
MFAAALWKKYAACISVSIEAPLVSLKQLLLPALNPNKHGN